MRTVRTDANKYFSIPSFRQIETFEGLKNEINTLIAEAKASANYTDMEDLLKRALSGVLVSSDGTNTMVDLARKSGDRAIYSITIKMLIRAKKRVSEIVDSWN